jgi:hypothetical protein
VLHNLRHTIGSPQTSDGYTELSWRGAVVDVVDIKGAPWRPSVESLVRSEADFRFRCAASSGRTLVRYIGALGGRLPFSASDGGARNNG